MEGKTAKLAYRPCVGIMLVNRDGLIWIGRRVDAPDEPEGRGGWWQMPQGGIDEQEDPRQAALRELYEETGVRSAEIVEEAPEWVTYELPPSLVGIAWGGRFCGQRQKWFAARFLGNDSEINLAPPGHKVEFDAWRWAPRREVLDVIVPFKRGAYEEVLRAFTHLTR
jgi:putative (di)nucleoside polyphosphate hydrolase